MTVITSWQNPAIKQLRALADKKARREQGLFVAEGLAMLERAAGLGWLPETFVATRPVAIWDRIKPLIVSEKLMGELSAQNNPHAVLASFKQSYSSQPAADGMWLALEEIRDPGNLGTIIRTADAVGVSGIILAGDSCDPYSPESVRGSTGSIFAVPLVKMSRQALLVYMEGFPGEVVGTAMHAAADFRRPYRQPLLLVMGSESRGISPAVSNACSQLVRIPMRPGVESLNVATAAALMLYQAARF